VHGFLKPQPFLLRKRKMGPVQWRPPAAAQLRGHRTLCALQVLYLWCRFPMGKRKGQEQNQLLYLTRRSWGRCGSGGGAWRELLQQWRASPKKRVMQGIPKALAKGPLPRRRVPLEVGCRRQHSCSKRSWVVFPSMEMTVPVEG
jgi:hypothetical protein